MFANNLHNNEQLQELQLKIAKGDETAFTHLYHHYYKKLFHFAKLLVRSNEIAEELVEDVFVKLWSSRSKVTEIENLTVYLYVVVKNKALNILSSKAKDLIIAPFDFLEIAGDSFTSNPYDLLITSEMMHRMSDAIDALPPRCKMIFRLVREDGLKYKEVAKILNISVNTIDVQMTIAVKKICMALHIQKPGILHSHANQKNN
ncbi:MAG: RNA polymerase sigma-70 factor [Bacteroidota bacterium]|nr:RNA polymerase sigma-70 factor [Bacteroidota bacterium]